MLWHNLAAACLLVLAIPVVARQSAPSLQGAASGRQRIVDMTYPIDGKFPAWPGDPKVFEATVDATPEKDGYFTRAFWTIEHYGTHIDAPVHFPPGKTTVDRIAPEKLFGPAVVIDIQKEAAANADYQLTAARIAEWEKRNGPIPEGAIVILRTGWSSRVSDPEKFRNSDSKGTMHFPGYSLEAAGLLLQRKIHGLGTDTLSIDPGNSTDYPVHHRVLGADTWQLENLANVNELPEKGAFIVVAPIKLVGGSGGPARVFAILP